jgi:hypothetical protein
MTDIARTRSPHVKLQEFMDCYLGTDLKDRLESFSSPKLTGPTREEIPDEALRYLAIALLYGLSERVENISFVRGAPDLAVCRMVGEDLYDIPAPREEIITSLFEQVEEMAGLEGSKRDGRLIIGLKNDEIDLRISSAVADSGGEKLIITLPAIA